MGFTDLISDAGLTLLNNWVKTRSYIVGYVDPTSSVPLAVSHRDAPYVAACI